MANQPARSAHGIPSSSIDRSARRRPRPRLAIPPLQRLPKRRRPTQSPNDRHQGLNKRRPGTHPGLRLPTNPGSRSRSPPPPRLRGLSLTGQHLPERPRHLLFVSRNLPRKRNLRDPSRPRAQARRKPHRIRPRRNPETPRNGQQARCGIQTRTNGTRDPPASRRLANSWAERHPPETRSSRIPRRRHPMNPANT